MTAGTPVTLVEDAKRQMTALPRVVQLWMRWLNVVFLLGLFFVVSQSAATWALVAYIAAMPVGFLVFYLTRDIRLTGLPHILFWGPLLAYLMHSMISGEIDLGSLLGLWCAVLSITIAISIVFDVRAIHIFLRRRQAVRDQVCTETPNHSPKGL